MRRPLTSGLATALILSPFFAFADGVRLVHYPRQTNPDRNGHPRMVVSDKDAHKGTAQAAIPSKSHPNGQLCSFYSYARPAGIYRFTWRVKIDDNTIKDPVFRAATGRGSINLKGTDFKAPNVYQEFSYTAEKGEGGFFAVSAYWPGKGRIHVDSVTAVSEKLYTEKEILAKKGGLKLPDHWFFPEPSPPNIHIAKGLWWDFFGLSEAMVELGGATFTSSYHSKGQYGASLRYFPQTWQALMSHNLVVLANVDAPALRARGRMMIEEFVRNGGGLLVLGGQYSLDRGGYRNTALARLLPCGMAGSRSKAEGGIVIRPAKDAGKAVSNLSWELKPRIFYYHPIVPKPNAQVWATADGKPVVIVGEFGKGRVGVIAATAEGDPGPDQLAFWEWGDTPKLTAAVCRWLVSAPREKQKFVIDEQARKDLEKLAVPNPGEKEGERRRLLRKLLAKCRDKAFAREILDTINNAESDPDRRFVKAVDRAIQPFVDEEFYEDAEALIESGEVGKAALGLRILGRCGKEDAGDLLKLFLEKGIGGFTEGGDVDDLLDPGGGISVDSGLEIGGNERLKLAAILGLGDLGVRTAMKDLRKTTTEYSRKRPKITEATDIPDLNENIYQQSLATRCILGDKHAVGPFLDAILMNTEEIEQFMNALETMLVNKDDKKLMNMRKVGRIRLPVLQRRQALCREKLSRLPVSMMNTFVQKITKRCHPILTPFAFAALARASKAKPDSETASSLLQLIRDCNIPELRLLAVRYIIRAEDPKLDADLASSLKEMAASPELTSSIFALRTATRLKQADRRAIVESAQKHSNPKVRRMAGLYAPLQGNVK